jgi:hypothetical protein
VKFGSDGVDAAMGPSWAVGVDGIVTEEAVALSDWNTITYLPFGDTISFENRTFGYRVEPDSMVSKTIS